MEVWTMLHRRQAGKHTLALWMLVAVADLGLLATAAGPLALMLVVLAAVAAVGAVIVSRQHRNAVPATRRVADVVVRRRA